MRNFILSIELSFMAETEALDILNACADVIKGGEYENEVKLIKQLQAQVESSVGEIKKIIDTSHFERPKILSIIDEAESIASRVKGYKQECEGIIANTHALSKQEYEAMVARLKEIEERAKLTISDLDLELKKAQSEVANHLAKLKEFDGIVHQAQQRIEACLFIRDMATVNKTLLASGKIALHGKDDIGNWVVKKTWEK